MGENSIVIEKLVIDVHMDDDYGNESMGLLNTTAEDLKTVVLPLFEKRINESGLASSDDLVKIDRLEVNISELLNGQWKESVGRQLAEEIIAQGEHKIENAEQNSVHSEETDNTPKGLLELWMHFLKFGVLPDWKTGINIHSLKELKVRLKEEDSIDEHAVKLRTILAHEISAFTRFVLFAQAEDLEKALNNKDAVLLAQLSRSISFTNDDFSGFRKELIQAAFEVYSKKTNLQMNSEMRTEIVEVGLRKLKENHRAIVASNKEAINCLSNSIEVFKSENEATQKSLKHGKIEKRIEAVSDGSLQVFLRLFVGSQELTTDQKRVMEKFILGERAADHSWMKFFSIMRNLIQSKEEQVIVARIIEQFETKGSTTVSKRLREQLIEERMRSEALDEMMQEDSIVQEESSVLDYAGVVLLKPFIPQLFSKLSLLNAKNEWKNDTSKREAIYILNFLSTGNFDATEDQLFLGKLLTGWNLEEVVERPAQILGIDVDEPLENHTQLHEEQMELLEVIRTNWRPMRNASWKGLQADFLTRSGRLTQTGDSNYELLVDAHGKDVMLPFKKWGIGVIRYSWMDTMINVNWE